MAIERLEKEEIEKVVQLSLRAWAPVFVSIERTMHAELYRRSYPDGWEASQRQTVEDACRSDEIEVWTAKEDGDVVGFAAIKLDRNSSMGEIYLIAVEPEHQGRGIASRLTDFAVARMKEAGMDLVMVDTGADAGHEPARRTYEKAGFHPWPSMRYFKYL